MQKNIFLGLVIAGSTMLSSVVSAETTSYYNSDMYYVTCTGTTSGYSWIRHTVGLMETFNAAGDCINEGGQPEIKSTNRPF